MQYNTGETTESLKNEYNPDGSVLRKCQLRLFDMLCYFDEICKKLNIEYRLDSGSVLGAVRHEGFIPWDDDLDVVISKKDEKKLRDYLISNPNSQYVLLCPQIDSSYLYPWNSLRDLKSEYLQDTTMHNVRKYRGMQIDIFTEQVGSIKPLFIFSKKLTALINHHLLGKVRLVPTLLCFIQKNLLIPSFSFLSKIVGNKNYCNFSYGIFWWHPIAKKTLYPTKPILFEGRLFPGPANPEKYLEIVYGKKWMNLPPKENRNWHKASYRIED